jgi:hypothetical protein
MVLLHFCYIERFFQHTYMPESLDLSSFLVRPAGVEPSTCGLKQGCFCVLPCAEKRINQGFLFLQEYTFPLALLSNCCQKGKATLPMGWLT